MHKNCSFEHIDKTWKKVDISNIAWNFSTFSNFGTSCVVFHSVRYYSTRKQRSDTNVIWGSFSLLKTDIAKNHSHIYV